MTSDNEFKVRVAIPADMWPTLIIGQSGENYSVETGADGNRFVMMTAEDARVLIGTPLPGNMPWREANQALLQQIGAPPKPEAGIRIANVLAEQYASRPRHPLDVGGQIHDTLRAMGVIR